MRANVTGFLILCLLLASVAATSASSVYVANYSFESPALADGALQEGGIPGWDTAAIYNPTPSQYAGTTGNGTPPGADGSQVGYVFGAFSTDSQILRGADGNLGTADDPLLESNQVYTMTVAVGARLDSAYGGYTIQILAYNPTTQVYTTLASQSDLITPTAGTFQDATLTFDSNTASPTLYGQNLAITLTNVTEDATDFDNVRLAVVPEPSPVLLLGIGIGLMAVAGRRMTLGTNPVRIQLVRPHYRSGSK
jgi:hypothetical protein